jgi:hypothetical protein
MADEICGGKGCTCKAGENGYCSEHCAKQGERDPADVSAQQCGCGHGECEADAA